MVLKQCWCDRKKFGTNFTTTKTKSYFSLHYNGNESNLNVNKTEICKTKRLEKYLFTNLV